jgi:Holliday junction resolvase-like predicted endonuclease
MAQHIESGKLGEQLAADYLQQRNYTVLHRN